MGIKADKTFEEIVERIVAVFRPQETAGVPDAQRNTDDANASGADTSQNIPPSAPSQSSDEPVESSRPE